MFMKTVRFKPALLLLALAVVSAAALSVWGFRYVAAAALPDGGIPMPVIMYHHVLEKSKLLGSYVITPGELENDFKYIQEQGYTPVLVADLIAYVRDGAPLPEKPIMITFDDGYESNYVYAFPLLKKYNFKAVISIYGRCTDEFTQTVDKHINYSHITWDEIKEMADSGLVEFQNHSYNMHRNGKGERKGIQKLGSESPEQYREALVADVGKLQEEFQEHLGYAPTAFTYPFGYMEPAAYSILKEMGFQASFSCEEKIHYITKDPESLYKIKRFNRPHDMGTWDFFNKINKTAKKPKG